MGERVDLHAILVTALGAPNVYFQPPESIQLQYPCIIYKRSSENVSFADNDKFKRKRRYTITVIDRDPDSLIPDRVSTLPYTSFNTHFTKDNLNHDVYTIYY